MEEKKVCLVTGASSGLGRNIARLLCENGFLVYVTARRKEELEKLREECEGGEIRVISGDLSKHPFRKKLISTIIKEAGEINYLVNNAGFGRAVKLEEMAEEEIHKMFEVNVVAYQHLANLALRDMKKRDFGRIINIGSVVAFTPLPYFTTYNSTKAAVYTFNRSLRYELKGSNITSTVVLPARMRTGFAEKAFSCYIKNGKKICVEQFNAKAGDSMVVARRVVNKIDKGKEVILPTFKSWLWYTMRYFGFVVDFAMNNFLGPKQRAELDSVKN